MVGEIFGEIKLKNTEDRYKKMPSCSNGFFDYENNKLSFSKDIREGLIWFINSMKECGEFIKIWEENNKFVWFVDFVESKNKKYDFREISRSKVDKCCEECKNIMKSSLGDD